MKSVLDLYKALMQRKIEVAEAKAEEQAPKAAQTKRQTQTIPAAALPRSRRTDVLPGFDSDYERV
ncbi:MAG TPA: hypothetical protein VHL11_19690 [Phototrophicaceae bacterium]|jgi:hypothetical protein|nr:hypothetical protein [Phototrophicaceae bacterium]